MKTLKVQLQVNCPYGKIGNIIEVSEDTAKAYWKDMKISDKKATENVDAVVSDIKNTKTQEKVEEKEVKKTETKEVKKETTK